MSNGLLLVNHTSAGCLRQFYGVWYCVPSPKSCQIYSSLPFILQLQIWGLFTWSDVWCSVPSPKSWQIVAIASVRHLILFRNKQKIVWRTFILSYIILANQEIYIFPKKRWTFVWNVKTNLSPLFPRWSVWWKTGFRVFILIFCLRPIGSQLLLEWKVCVMCT